MKKDIIKGYSILKDMGHSHPQNDQRYIPGEGMVYLHSNNLGDYIKRQILRRKGHNI